MDESCVGYRDRQGVSIDVLRWAELFQREDYRFLKREALTNGRYVVTIWGGILSPVIPPGLFSTGVFASAPAAEKPLGALLHEEFWETEAEALAGHQAAVQKWSAP